MPVSEREPVRAMIKRKLGTKNVWIFATILFFMSCGMQFTDSFYKAYGQTFIYDDHFLALVRSIASIFICVFIPIWGLVMDKYGFETTVKMICALFTVLSCTIMYTEKMHKIVFLLWIGSIYGSCCGMWVIFLSVLENIFGVKHMSVAIGFHNVIASIGLIGGGFIGLTLHAVIGWHWLFICAGGLGTVYFFITFLFGGLDTNDMTI